MIFKRQLYLRLTSITSHAFNRIYPRVYLQAHQPQEFRHPVVLASKLKSYSSSTLPPSSSSQKPRLLLAFTCTVCSSRSSHLLSKQAYTSGVVLVQCPGCQNRHLIADHLGWFQEGKVTVEDLVRRKGEFVRKGVAVGEGADGVLEWEAEDIDSEGEIMTVEKEKEGR